MSDENKGEEKKDYTVGIRNMWRSVMDIVSFSPGMFIITFVSAVAFFLVPLLTSLMIREILNIMQGVGQFDFKIWTIIWLLPVAYIFYAITDIIYAIGVWIITLSARILLRRNVLDGILKQHGAKALTISPGRAISRFRGDTMEMTWFAALLPDISGFAIFAIIAFAFMYSINSTVTLVVFGPFVIIVLIINMARRKLTEYREAARKTTGRVTGMIGETFNAIQAIKVAAVEGPVIDQFVKLSDERRIASVRDNGFAAVLRSIGSTVISISIGAMLLLVGDLMSTGEFTVGDLVLFTMLLRWITGFINYLGNYIAWKQRAEVSHGRMISLMKGERIEIEDSDLTKKGEIYVKNDYPAIPALHLGDEDILREFEVKDLHYQYPTATAGIEGISFKIKSGTLNVITGRIGSGKSTILKCLLGLLPKDKGSIHWNGSEIDRPEDYLIPPRTSYTAQVPTLFSETIEENILSGLPVDSVDLHESVEMAVFEEDVALFEDGLETVIGPKGVKLSGGQKHRVAAARMLIRKPQLVLFDDLSSALDVNTEKELWKRIFKDRGSTFLITSHRKMVLEQADNIIVIKDGRIDSQGKLQDLLKESAEMQWLWNRDEGSMDKEVLRLNQWLDQNVPWINLDADVKNLFPLFSTHNSNTSISNRVARLLVDTALQDDEIVEEEITLIENIIGNVASYEKLIVRALERGSITEDDRDQLLALREMVIEEAVDHAMIDDTISNDENLIIEQLKDIVTRMKELE